MMIAALFRWVKAWHWRLPAAVGAALLVLSVGFSRIALGAHYLTDVLGAIALGIVWIYLCLTVTLNVRRTFVRAVSGSHHFQARRMSRRSSRRLETDHRSDRVEMAQLR
jgi:membrane-associated phospholipid phosphatase